MPNTSHLQLKRNLKIFDSKEVAVAYLKNDLFLKSCYDGEPIIARYTENGSLKSLIRIVASDDNNVKSVTISTSDDITEELNGKEDASNKVSSLTDVSSLVKYPSNKAVVDYVASAPSTAEALPTSLIDELF